MVHYTTVIISVYALLVTIAAAIMGYLLTIPCMTTSIKGENNKVRNKQKVDILSPNIELFNNSNQFSTWQLIGFEVFEWIVLSFLIIALIYWGLGKIFRKDRLLDTMRKRKEETKSRKLQKMREVLTRQGLIISDSTVDIEEKITEVALQPFKG